MGSICSIIALYVAFAEKDHPLFNLPTNSSYRYRSVTPPTINSIKSKIRPYNYDLLKGFIKSYDSEILDTVIKDEKGNEEIISILLTAKAKGHIDSGDPFKAEELLREAIKMDPNNRCALIFLRESCLIIRDKFIDDCSPDMPSTNNYIEKIKKYKNEIEKLEKQIESAQLLLRNDNFISYHSNLHIDNQKTLSSNSKLVIFKQKTDRSPDSRENLSQPDAFTTEYLPGFLRSDTTIFDTRANLNIVTEPLYSDLFQNKNSYIRHRQILNNQNNNRLLAIGINDYNDTDNKTITSLKYATNDAVKVAKHFQNNGFAFDLLINGQATRFSIINKIASEIFISRKSDTFILYIAGHGLLDKNGNRFIVVNNKKLSSIELIPMEVVNSLLQLHNGKVLAIVDTCFEKIDVDLSTHLIETLPIDVNRRKNIKIFYASSNGEKAIESEYLKGGIATYTLLEYLNDHPGIIDIDKMFGYMKSTTITLAMNLHQLLQHPITFTGDKSN